MRSSTGRRAYDIDLGDSGLAYLRQNLLGGNAFSRALLAGLPLADGKVTASVFRKTDLPAEFDWRPSEEVGNLQWSRVVDSLVNFLGANDRNLAVFEHPFAAPGDQWLSRKPLPFATFEGSVLFLVNRSFATSELARVVLWEAGAQDERGALVSTREPWVAGTEIEKHAVDAAIQDTAQLIVRAFDAEGYMLWRRGRASQAHRD
jgi:hypothetical protein